MITATLFRPHYGLFRPYLGQAAPAGFRMGVMRGPRGVDWGGYLAVRLTENLRTRNLEFSSTFKTKGSYFFSQKLSFLCLRQGLVLRSF